MTFIPRGYYPPGLMECNGRHYWAIDYNAASCPYNASVLSECTITPCDENKALIAPCMRSISQGDPG